MGDTVIHPKETAECQVPGCGKPTIHSGVDAFQVGINVTNMVCWGCAARWHHVKKLLDERGL